MNITRAFVEFLENENIGAFDDDIFIGAGPKTDDVPDRILWVISNGGTPLTLNKTGERQKSYILSLYMRSQDAEDVETTLQNIEELINSDRCTQLTGYDTIDIEATNFASDQDIDNEDRTVGLLQITITTYL